MKSAAQKLRDKERLAAWRKANPDLERERKRKWKEANPEKLKASSKAYYERNRDTYNARSREYYAANKAQRLAATRGNALQRNFGITSEQYEELLKAQAGACGLCGTHSNDLPCKLAVDHCHDNGHVRGLLCVSCNRLLGTIEKNAKRLPLFLAWSARGDAMQQFIRSERQ